MWCAVTLREHAWHRRDLTANLPHRTEQPALHPHRHRHPGGLAPTGRS
jgi:hypothetical protein